MIYSPQDGETDVTPRDITDLSVQEQIEFITLWFRALFEDPQNEMPYADKDEPNNYRYPWGGPYDAQDEIHNAFEGLASEKAIKIVAEEMIQECPFEWAPTSMHPERRAREQEAIEDRYWNTSPPTLEEILMRLQSGVTPSFGDPLERQERVALRHALAELRMLLTQTPPQHGRMGHNEPPEDSALAVELSVEATQAIDRMDTELTKEVPNVATVAASTRQLQEFLSWIGRKIDNAVDKFVGTVAVAGGGTVVLWLNGVPISQKIREVLDASLEWMNTVTFPF